MMTIQYFKKTLTYCMILAAILAGLLALTGCKQPTSYIDTGEGKDVTPIPTPVVPTKPTYTVQRGDVVNQVEFTGRITPVKEVDLSFHTNGYVRNILVERGESVKEGQVLAELEVSDLENQLAQSQLSLKTSETQLAAAQQLISDTLVEAHILLDIEKIKLEQAQYYSQANGGKAQEFNLRIQEQMVELAQLKVDRLERGVDPQLVLAVESARLTIQRLQEQLADTQILAPMDGVVTSINIFNSGQAVAAYMPVITVGDLNQLEVSADLFGDRVVGQLSPGMEVVVEPYERPDAAQIPGVIRYVPTGAPGETDKTTRISLNSSPEDAQLGLSDLVRVKTIIESKTNVLWLPPQAIRSFEGRRFVVVQDDQGLHRVDVQTGVEGSEAVEIVSGLTEGQIVQAP
jgi:multidrug efflux pump subunit AcrA (membrane-fusion protein)